MKSKISLLAALKAGRLVRVTRERVESGWINGYVVAIGEDLFALLVVDDHIRFDGFYCIRFEDVTDVTAPAPYAAFIEKALSLRRLTRPTWLGLDLTSVGDLLRSVGPDLLVSLHLDYQDASVCHIGRVHTVTDKTVQLLEINPDATWDTEPRRRYLQNVTRVDLGGEYEAALLLVSGELERS